jgi:hypothetical protein
MINYPEFMHFLRQKDLINTCDKHHLIRISGNNLIYRPVCINPILEISNTMDGDELGGKPTMEKMLETEFQYTPEHAPSIIISSGSIRSVER